MKAIKSLRIRENLFPSDDWFVRTKAYPARENTLDMLEARTTCLSPVETTSTRKE